MSKGMPHCWQNNMVRMSGRTGDIYSGVRWLVDWDHMCYCRTCGNQRSPHKHDITFNTEAQFHSYIKSKRIFSCFIHVYSPTTLLENKLSNRVKTPWKLFKLFCPQVFAPQTVLALLSSIHNIKDTPNILQWVWLCGSELVEMHQLRFS